MGHSHTLLKTFHMHSISILFTLIVFDSMITSYNIIKKVVSMIKITF